MLGHREGLRALSLRLRRHPIVTAICASVAFLATTGSAWGFFSDTPAARILAETLAEVAILLTPRQWVAGSVMFISLAVLIAILVALLKPERPVPPESGAEPERSDRQEMQEPRKPLVAGESLEQLRQVHWVIVQSTGIALQYLKKDFLNTVSEPEDCGRFVGRLLKEYALPAFEEDYFKTYPRIDEEVLDEKSFEEVLDACSKVLGHYYLISQWILWANRLFFNGDLLLEERYRGWYSAHQELLAILRRVEPRRDIGRIAAHRRALAGLLPEPKSKTP